MGRIDEASDEELARYAAALKREQDRRRTLDTTEKQVQELSAAYLSAAGVEPGQEWKQPTSAVDAYPKDWTVEHGNKTWVSLVAANVFEPGVSSWREVVPEGSAPSEWVQPSGATDAYNTGDQVTYNGEVFESVIDANTWSPTDYPQGWELVS